MAQKRRTFLDSEAQDADNKLDVHVALQSQPLVVVLQLQADIGEALLRGILGIPLEDVKKEGKRRYDGHGGHHCQSTDVIPFHKASDALCCGRDGSYGNTVEEEESQDWHHHKVYFKGEEADHFCAEAGGMAERGGTYV